MWCFSMRLLHKAALGEEQSPCLPWVSLSWFPVLAGEADTVFSDSEAFISQLVEVEMPNTVVLCPAYPTSVLA